MLLSQASRHMDADASVRMPIPAGPPSRRLQPSGLDQLSHLPVLSCVNAQEVGLAGTMCHLVAAKRGVVSQIVKNVCGSYRGAKVPGEHFKDRTFRTVAKQSWVKMM